MKTFSNHWIISNLKNFCLIITLDVQTLRYIEAAHCLKSWTWSNLLTIVWFSELCIIFPSIGYLSRFSKGKYIPAFLLYVNTLRSTCQSNKLTYCLKTPHPYHEGQYKHTHFILNCLLLVAIFIREVSDKSELGTQHSEYWGDILGQKALPLTEENIYYGNISVVEVRPFNKLIYFILTQSTTFMR